MKVGDLVRIVNTRHRGLFVVKKLGDEWAHIYSLKKLENHWEKIKLLVVVNEDR